MRFKPNILLLDGIVQHLKELGWATLKHVAKQEDTHIWSQGCKSAKDIGLEGNFKPLWNYFVIELKKTHVKLTQEEGSLIRVYKKDEDITLKN